MNSPNKRFVFDIALEEDADQILEVLEEGDFKGGISLLYTRRPNAYQSFMKEGEETLLVVCRDMKENRLAGIGGCMIHSLYMNGEVKRVGYLLGLRIRPAYQRTYRLLHRGYEYLKRILKGRDIDFFYTTILEDNAYTRKLLEKRRSFMPDYRYMDDYNVLIFKSSGRSVKGVRRARPEDLSRITPFLEDQGRSHQLFPQPSRAVYGQYPGLSIEDFYIMEDGEGQITAVGAAWDQSSYKQYILKDYGGIYKKLYGLSKILPWLGLPGLPAPGSILGFYTLSFWVVKDNDPQLLHRFITGVSALKREYPFFVMGAPKTHPLWRELKRKPHLSYRSRLYRVDFQKGREDKDQMEPPFYLECGLL